MIGASRMLLDGHLGLPFTLLDPYFPVLAYQPPVPVAVAAVLFLAIDIESFVVDPDIIAISLEQPVSFQELRNPVRADVSTVQQAGRKKAVGRKRSRTNPAMQ